MKGPSEIQEADRHFFTLYGLGTNTEFGSNGLELGLAKPLALSKHDVTLEKGLKRSTNENETTQQNNQGRVQDF